MLESGMNKRGQGGSVLTLFVLTPLFLGIDAAGAVWVRELRLCSEI